MTGNQEVLAGLVERVTFHNAESGFCVLRVKARGQRNLATVVGHTATISAGEWITASGEWINARHSDARCFIPPESSEGRLPSNPSSPTSFRVRAARSACSAFVYPMISSGRRTFAAMVRQG